MALAKTVDRKEKNVMFTALLSETIIGFPEESRNPIPCKLPTTKKRDEPILRYVPLHVPLTRLVWRNTLPPLRSNY